MTADPAAPRGAAAAARPDLRLVESQKRPPIRDVLAHDDQGHPAVDYAPIQSLVTTELTAVKSAASAWAGSISTLVGLGSVFGLTVGKEAITPLVTGTLLGRAFVLAMVALFGLGVVFAQVASQGSLHRSTPGVNPADPAEALYKDTVQAIRSARWYTMWSRRLVGVAALATWLVLLWTVWDLGTSKVIPVYYSIEGPGQPAQCVASGSVRTSAQGRITVGGIAVPPGGSVKSVSSCP